jgi:hypothetical protein
VKNLHGGSGLTVYRDTVTGQLHFRYPGDFQRRMKKLVQQPKVSLNSAYCFTHNHAYY